MIPNVLYHIKWPETSGHLDDQDNDDYSQGVHNTGCTVVIIRRRDYTLTRQEGLGGRNSSTPSTKG